MSDDDNPQASDYLTTAERAEIAARMCTRKLGDNQHSGGASDEAPSISEAEAAEIMKVSRSSVQRAKARLRAQATPEPRNDDHQDWTEIEWLGLHGRYITYPEDDRLVLVLDECSGVGVPTILRMIGATLASPKSDD